MIHRSRPILATLALATVALPSSAAETVGLWLFDEPVGLYPSTPLESAAGLDAPLVLGLGGRVVPGKFGQALSTAAQTVEIPAEGEETAALHRYPIPAGRTQEPLSWHNAQFAALMTGGEKHIRKEVSFASVTKTGLNLGAFDWTVEFWFRANAGATSGVVLELGSGPRGENDVVTRLTLDAASGRFVFENQPGAVRAEFPADAAALRDASAWHHYAFVHDAARGEIAHYVDGRRQGASVKVAVKALPVGGEDYLSVARDGRWGRPLPGLLDELRLSRGAVYTANFAPPASFAPTTPAVALPRPTLPLLFSAAAPRTGVVPLGSRKHLFIDDALIERSEHVSFAAHAPQRVDRVLDEIVGQFRKHLTVVEDGDGLIRLYNGGPDDFLMVHTSKDGLNFTAPDTGLHHKGRKNIVIPEHAPLGRPIIDPNGPPEHRWKYVSGLEGRGVYLFTSPDGWKWQRHRPAVLPFRSGSQSGLFYDDQRGLYVGYHRTGFPESEGGGTRREFVLSETTDLYHPWPVTLQTPEQVREIARTRRLRKPQPWWLDNGPLTPGDFGVELPTVFAPDDRIDPPGSGVYVPKADKYPWAPDAYLAFPAMYFDYEEPDQPATRRVLYEEKSRGLGSGVVETQVAVSRDGVNWKRYPVPAYVPIGVYQGRRLHQIYLSEGMVRRGDEVWQYFFGTEEYHSPARRNPAGQGVYRTVQRLDGYVSAESPYDKLATLVTRPLTFTGRRLELNIDTRGLGYAQVGLEDEHGRPIPGYGVDDCVFINGNFVRHTVEWLGRGPDVSSLAGRTVRVVVKMRNTSLYSLQFVP
jgi:hypothetical protein